MLEQDAVKFNVKWEVEGNKATLISNDLNLRITVGNYITEIENKRIAYKMFEMALGEMVESSESKFFRNVIDLANEIVESDPSENINIKESIENITKDIPMEWSKLLGGPLKIKLLSHMNSVFSATLFVSDFEHPNKERIQTAVKIVNEIITESRK